MINLVCHTRSQLCSSTFLFSMVNLNTKFQHIKCKSTDSKYRAHMKKKLYYMHHLQPGKTQSLVLTARLTKRSVSRPASVVKHNNLVSQLQLLQGTIFYSHSNKGALLPKNTPSFFWILPIQFYILFKFKIRYVENITTKCFHKHQLFIIFYMHITNPAR